MHAKTCSCCFHLLPPFFASAAPFPSNLRPLPPSTSSSFTWALRCCTVRAEAGALLACWIRHSRASPPSALLKMRRPALVANEKDGFGVPPVMQLPLLPQRRAQRRCKRSHPGCRRRLHHRHRHPSTRSPRLTDLSTSATLASLSKPFVNSSSYRQGKFNQKTTSCFRSSPHRPVPAGPSRRSNSGR